MMNSNDKWMASDMNDEPSPPILGTWNKLYLFVLACHALLIFLFYLFTKAYS
jgi:hypothetical protein